MKYEMPLSGVCSVKVEFDLEDDDTVRNVNFTGGCNGNLKAVASLVDGMTVDQIKERLQGITCGFKDTSCSDQFTKALIKAVSERAGRTDAACAKNNGGAR